MRTPVLALTAAASLAAGAASPAAAAGDISVPSVKWSFDGPFGTYDRASLQRGYQVFAEVCSACHAVNHLA